MKINATQLKMTDILAVIYPVGSIYFNASSSTNPATLLGFGTWSAFGAGRCLVGKSAETEFDTLEETGGAKTVTLDTTQIPAHTHTTQAHSHGYSYASDRATGSYVGTGKASSSDRYTNYTTATNQNTGGGGAHNNLQPYIVTYIWKRTA